MFIVIDLAYSKIGQIHVLDTLQRLVAPSTCIQRVKSAGGVKRLIVVEFEPAGYKVHTYMQRSRYPLDRLANSAELFAFYSCKVCFTNVI